MRLPKLRPLKQTTAYLDYLPYPINGIRESARDGTLSSELGPVIDGGVD